MQQNDDAVNVANVVFLRCGRVNLRPPMKADIPHFLRWFNDPEVRQYIKNFLPMGEIDEARWLENLHKNKRDNIVLVMVDAALNKPIGTMGIHRIDWKDRRATTGAVIGEEEYRSKGYGSEAKMHLLNYAFNTLNLRKICSSVYDFNGRSQAYNKKCGYEIEGVLREQVFINGRYVDQVLMAVFRDKWLPLWEGFQKRQLTIS